MKKSLLVMGLVCGSLLNACGGGGNTPPPQVATHLSLTAPGGALVAGMAFNVTVSALDASNAVVSTYSGMVHFTSSDMHATLPADSQLTGGMGTFPVTLKTTGEENVTVADVTGVLTAGNSGMLFVSPGPATQFSVTTPTAATSGFTFHVGVTAVDAFSNQVTSYNGMAKITSSDMQAILPGSAVPLAGGSGNFPATLKTLGNQTITATDTVTASLTGSSGAINVVSNAVTHLAVTVPGPSFHITTRETFNFQVQALDAANNRSTSYAGTLHFTSTDNNAMLPADSMLAGGSAILSATLETAGNQTITATDTAVASLTQTSSTINITAAAALTIISGPAPDGVTGSGYFFPVITTGGVPGQGYALSWVAAAGSSLPPGLVVANGQPAAPSGVIQGAPAAGSAGTYNVIVTVTDSGKPPVQTSMNYAITIKNPPPPAITAVPVLPGAALNKPFTFTFTATNGLPPLTWSETGALPPGISPLTSGGVLSGTPTGTGSFPITVDVQDADGQNATPQNFTIQVFPHGFGLTAASMETARLVHTATLLSSGKVLIAGGQLDVSHLLVEAELFDPVAQTFTPTGSLQNSRAEHTATLLCDLSAPPCNNDKVLLAGGSTGADGNFIAAAELYDPASGAFTQTGSLSTPRHLHAATLLTSGNVLIAGGLDASGNSLASAELFDPATGTFSTTGSMAAGRGAHTATLLADGKVLVTGGQGGTAASPQHLASAELYDPATGTFSSAGNMILARASHTATRLGSGKLLLAGGNNNMGMDLNTAELFDPASGSFTATGNLLTARSQHTAVLLNDGTVLLAGGFNNGSVLRSTELFDPTTGMFTGTGALQVPRVCHTMTLLNSSGAVLVTGGVGVQVWASAELYQ